MKKYRVINLLLFLCLGGLLYSCGLDMFPGQSTPNGPSLHILLIGNSFTYINGGMDRQIRGLAPSAVISMIANGGYTLEDHWNDGSALKKIRAGGWNYVVLQEQSQTPVTNPEQFDNYAAAFDGEIRNQGARTILWMTWERPDSVQYGVTTGNLANAFYSLGKAQGIIVAPVGLAFARSLQGRPDLILNNPDGHPTVYGTYLAACVLYGTIFMQNPVGNPYSDGAISEDMRTYLQQTAAATLGY